MITRYDDIRYSITVPDDFNIGFVCCITWVLIGIVSVIRLGRCLYVFQRLSFRRGRLALPEMLAQFERGADLEDE